ncbi:MAG TPA: hypothetical protein PLR06_07795, partial [Cyclobacteriaceae bacterium]|nr:hypothetical protein [Cyclobacteriaceae bacterium]
LQSGISQIIVAFSNPVTPEQMRQINGVESVKNLGNYRFQVKGKQGEDIRGSLVAWASQNNLGLMELKVVENSLESIFSELTRTEEQSA